MNNKGFAITTIVYGIVILLVLVAFTGISILKNEYYDKKDLVEDIKEELNTCLENNEC